MVCMLLDDKADNAVHWQRSLHCKCNHKQYCFICHPAAYKIMQLLQG